MEELDGGSSQPWWEGPSSQAGCVTPIPAPEKFPFLDGEELTEVSFVRGSGSLASRSVWLEGTGRHAFGSRGQGGMRLPRDDGSWSLL